MRASAWSAPAAVLVVVLATAFLFWPMVDGAVRGEPRWFAWDVPDQYWPDLVMLCRSLHDGELPTWNPYDRGGYPAHADPQSGMYHPLSWAICAAAGPEPALGWATWRVPLGFLMAGLFGLLWLRRIGAPWSGAVLGAVALQAAPFMRHNWELNLTLAMAFLPLCLWAAEGVARERRLADGAWLGVALALTGWVGSPPALFLIAVLTALYLAFRIVEETLRANRADAAAETRRDRAPPPDGAERRSRWARAGLSIAAAVLGIALAAAMLAVVTVPGLGLAEHSVQAGRSLASIAEGSLETADLVALVRPRPGNHLYIGLLAVALGATALVSARGALRFFLAAVAVVAVLMTLGDHAPLFPFAFDHLPGVGLFRLPHRYEAWLGPVAAGLAALGLGALERARVPADPWRLRTIALLLAAAGAAGIVLLPERGPGLLLAGTAVVLGALSLGARAVGSVTTGALLAAALLADVTQSMPWDRHLRHDAEPVSRTTEAALLRRAGGTRDRWRYMDEFGVSCRSGTRRERRDFRGYQDPLMLASYERVMAALGEHPALAAQYNVRYVLAGPHFIHGWNRHYLPPPAELIELPGTRVLHRAGERSLIELPHVLPFAYFVADTEIVHAVDRSAALRRTVELAPGGFAILDGEREPARAELPGDGEGGGPVVAAPPTASGTVVRFSPDEVRLRIEAPERGVVVVNELFYPGWRATVDGRPVPIFRANALVRAVPVSRGRHAIVMRFEPPRLSALRWLALAASFGALALIAGSFRRRRPGPDASGRARA